MEALNDAVLGQAVASDVSSETMGDMRRLYEHHLHPAVLFSTFLSEVSKLDGHGSCLDKV